MFNRFSLHGDGRTPLSSARPEILPTYRAPAKSTDCFPYQIFFFAALIGLFVVGLTVGVVFCIFLPASEVASEVAINTLATRSLISQAAFPNASAYLALRMNASHHGLEEILKRNGTKHAIKVNITSVEDSAEGKDEQQILCERDEECPPTLHQRSNGNDDEGKDPQNQQSDPTDRYHCHKVHIHTDKINHTLCIHPLPRKEYDFYDRKWRPDWDSILNKLRDSDFELSEVGNFTWPKDLKHLEHHEIVIEEYWNKLKTEVKKEEKEKKEDEDEDLKHLEHYGEVIEKYWHIIKKELEMKEKEKREKREEEEEDERKKDNGRERRQLVVLYMVAMDKDGDGIPEGLLPIKPDGASL